MITAFSHWALKICFNALNKASCVESQVTLIAVKCPGCCSQDLLGFFFLRVIQHLNLKVFKVEFDGLEHFLGCGFCRRNALQAESKLTQADVPRVPQSRTTFSLRSCRSAAVSGDGASLFLRVPVLCPAVVFCFVRHARTGFLFRKYFKLPFK